MDGQEFIISTIEANMYEEPPEEERELDFIKYVSRSSLIPIGDYDAVICEIEKTGDNNKIADSSPQTEIESLTLGYIIKASNINELNETDFKTALDNGKSRLRKIKNVLLAAYQGKVKSIIFDEADINYITISAVPVIIFSVPVRVKSKI